MNTTEKRLDTIPEEFNDYEEAAAFWDAHDTTDYLDAFRTVDVETEFRGRRYEIEIDADVALVLRERAERYGVTTGHLASDLLRKQVAAGG